jgi:hypothetical protein
MTTTKPTDKSDFALSNPEKYRSQHKLRLSYMPWLYARLKPEHRVWAQAWQNELQMWV